MVKEKSGQNTDLSLNVDSLIKENEKIKKQLTEIEKRLEKLEKEKSDTITEDPKLKSLAITTDMQEPEIIEETASSSSLGQNQPNPFTENTVIKYTLAETTNNAALYIFDMNGKQIGNYKIENYGQGELTIHGATLNAGMYFYTLIADGREIETRKMILTE